MKLSVNEQELSIVSMRDDDTIKIYASDTIWIHRLDKMCADNPNYKMVSESVVGGDVVGKTYILPKKALTIRKKAGMGKTSDDEL